MKKCETCETLKQLQAVKQAFSNIFLNGSYTPAAATRTGEAINPGDEAEHEKKKRIPNQTISAIEKVAYQRGFHVGKSEGFDEGMRFYRRDEKIIRTVVRDTAIQGFIDETLEIGGPGRMNSTELYARFTEWFAGKKSEAEIPNIVIFGRNLGRILQKQKSSGVVYYLGIKPKENPGDSSVLI